LAEQEDKGQAATVALVPINPATVGFQADKETQVSTDLVALVKGMCQLLDVPVMGLNILGGRPYINLDGYYWRAKRDGLKSISVEVHQEATGDKPAAKMTATVTLSGPDGDRTFTATAWHSAATEKMSTMKPPDLVNMKCESKAIRRALRMATGIGSGFATEEEAAEDEARRDDPKAAGLVAQRTFWSRAAEIHPAPEGAPYAVDKAAVHKALGVDEANGALRLALDRYKDETGVDEAQAWADVLAYIEDRHIGVVRYNPLTSPIDTSPEAADQAPDEGGQEPME